MLAARRRDGEDEESEVEQLGPAVLIAQPAERHDQLVAVISHVPHLAAATLMGLASDRAEEHASLLRLAAGGFVRTLDLNLEPVNT